MEYGRSIDRKSFFYGFTGGVFFLLLLFSAALFFVSSEGLTVKLDSEQMALMIQQQVAEQAKKELPQVVDEAKEEIPRIVQEEMQNQISDRMEIAGFVFRMPEELMNQLELNMQKNVENATALILDGINTEKIAENFGANVYDLVKKTLQQEIHGQSFRVLVFDRVPVTVNVYIT